jgi:hypothetical protein
MDKKILNSSIIKGISCAYQNSVSFYNHVNPYVKPEYLVTVNVAQSINEDFKNLIIKLEEPCISPRILKFRRNLIIYFHFRMY